LIPLTEKEKLWGSIKRDGFPAGSQFRLFGSQVQNQSFPIKTLARVAPRHDDWAMQKLLPREVLFQAVNLVDQWLKSMLISKR
jgi:hypothetical protein